ncbi:hypothetical protein EJ06DRAFT_167652 [Trichodelitschia bisporula]|uniref:C2H2-type domain-containing protein n=1 Tax=Trichodelitschia bisporula TaxID=703511 RepID=A0A6G1HMI7_9PEZI|nr:hypothetical protein EJ06DRAFT_167652 [Trichodelitschia bisporula]
MRPKELRFEGGSTSLKLFLVHCRTPTFLQRNVRAVLNAHEKAGGKAKNPSVSRKPTAVRIAWDTVDLPEEAIWHRAQEMAEPQLVVSVKGLKPMRGRNGDPRIALKTRLGRFQVVQLSCDIEVSVWHTQDNLKRSLWREVQTAHLVGRVYEDNTIDLNVNIEKLFVIKKKNLLVRIQNGKRWVQGLDNNYEMCLKLQFQSSEDAEQIMPLLYGSQVASPYTPKTNLAAKWLGLPKCPPAGTVLPISRIFEGRKKMTEYGYEIEVGWETDLDVGCEVDMGWQVRGPILNNVNHLIKSAASKLKPEAEAMDVDKNSVKVVYRWDDRAVTVSGFSCLYCRKTEKSATRLRFHLEHFHASRKETFSIISRDGRHVTFSMPKQGKGGGRKSPEPEAFPGKPIVVNGPDPNTKGMPNPTGHLWVAPNDTFDINKYLDGGDTWVARGLKGRKGKATPSAAQSDVEEETPRKGPEDVQLTLSRGPTARKRYVVPYPEHGGQFWSTKEKRVLRPGEFLSESDDEPEMSWQAPQRRAVYANINVCEDEKDVLVSWELHIMRENLAGDRYYGDAAIRYTHARMKWLLQKPERLEAWYKKLRRMKQQKLLEENFLVFILEMIRKQNEKYYREREIPDSEGGDAMQIDDDTPEVEIPQTNPIPRRRKDACICGELATTLADTIMCFNSDVCKYPLFHLKCIGLTTPLRGWVCLECMKKEEEA